MARDYSRQEVLDIIEREANERSIPRDDFLRFAYIETGGTFNEQASRGERGAKGLFQFVPSTATQYGIRGQELDAVANTDAAARLYLDNSRALTRQHDRDSRPYLSGKPAPDGLDMYMAHQQGAGGYRSIQAAIATGSFSRADTRANLLNNVSDRDLQTITGTSRAQLSAMSDRDMATTFVRYWDTKFDRISIPEKSIAPVTDRTQTQPTPTQPQPAQTQTQPAPTPTQPGQTQTQPAPTPQTQAGKGISLNAAYDMGVKYDDVQYAINIKTSKLYHPGVDGKHLEQGYIDCSGWVTALQNKTMAEINQKAGREVFGRKDLFDPGNDGSGEIVKKAFERSGKLLEGDELRKPGALKEGMVIGVDSGKTSHEHWKGIDHIMMVVRDPKSGELLVSQSTGSKGVHTMPLDEYLAGHKNTTLFAADPLAKGRDLLQDKQVDKQQTNDRGALADGKLSFGEKGADVKGLQDSLIKLGIKDDSGKLLTGTGNYGEHTKQAVANFQKGNGIEPTGVADKATLEAIGKKLPDGKVTVEKAEITGVVPKDKPTAPLITDANHPNNALYAAIGKQLPAGTKPEAIANVTLQAIESGINSPDKLKSVRVDGNNVFIEGSTPGFRSKTDLAAPTPSLQDMSEHMGKQTAQEQARTQRQPQVAQPQM